MPHHSRGKSNLTKVKLKWFQEIFAFSNIKAHFVPFISQSSLAVKFTAKSGNPPGAGKI